MASESTYIERRDDVNPTEGEREYGDVTFADPTNKKYPIDTPEHIRAAWSYINHKDNAAKYDKDEVDDDQEPDQTGGEEARGRYHRGLAPGRRLPRRSTMYLEFPSIRRPNAASVPDAPPIPQPFLPPLDEVARHPAQRLAPSRARTGARRRGPAGADLRTSTLRPRVGVTRCVAPVRRLRTGLGCFVRGAGDPNSGRDNRLTRPGSGAGPTTADDSPVPPPRRRPRTCGVGRVPGSSAGR